MMQKLVVRPERVAAMRKLYAKIGPNVLPSSATPVKLPGETRLQYRKRVRKAVKHA